MGKFGELRITAPMPPSGFVGKMSLFVSLCDEVIPVIRALVLKTGFNTNAREKDS